MGAGRFPLDQEIGALLDQPNWSRERLAAEVGVSAATIARWRSGAGSPRPAAEGRLRQVLASNAARNGDDHVAQAGDGIRSALASALNEAREALHRHARISSRHEALDEVCAARREAPLAALVVTWDELRTGAPRLPTGVVISISPTLSPVPGA